MYYSSRKFPIFSVLVCWKQLLWLVNPCIRHLRLHVSQYINHCLKSEVAIMLCCQLCSIHYTAAQINNCLKRTCAAIMKITDDFPLQMEVITCLPQNGYLLHEWRWMGHKGGHWWAHEGIVWTVVWKKAHLGLKQCQTMKTQALKASVRQLVSQ